MTAERGKWLDENRARWDELAQLHAMTPLYDLDAVVEGRDDLRPWEDSELGPIEGLDVIHLQCHLGTDTVGLARRGARTVGLDFSRTALDTARDLARRCGLSIDFVESDVLAATISVGRTFDVVYTGIGALGWLPDLQPWARVVHDLLRPGGILYLTELHPMWIAVIEDGRTICQHAIRAPFERWDEDGSYADPAARLRHAASWERLHSISDVLTALLDADLSIELFTSTTSPPHLLLGSNGAQTASTALGQSSSASRSRTPYERAGVQHPRPFGGRGRHRDGAGPWMASSDRGIGKTCERFLR